MQYINDVELEQVDGGIWPIILLVVILMAASTPLGEGSDLSCGCGCSCCK